MYNRVNRLDGNGNLSALPVGLNRQRDRRCRSGIGYSRAGLRRRAEDARQPGDEHLPVLPGVLDPAERQPDPGLLPQVRGDRRDDCRQRRRQRDRCTQYAYPPDARRHGTTTSPSSPQPGRKTWGVWRGYEQVTDHRGRSHSGCAAVADGHPLLPGHARRSLALRHAVAVVHGQRDRIQRRELAGRHRCANRSCSLVPAGRSCPPR